MGSRNGRLMCYKSPWGRGREGYQVGPQLSSRAARPSPQL